MKKPLKGFFYLISDKDNFVSDFHTFLNYSGEVYGNETWLFISYDMTAQPGAL